MARQIQGSARWRLGRIYSGRPPVVPPSKRLPAWPTRGVGSAVGDICPPRELRDVHMIHSTRTASTRAVPIPKSLPTAIPTPAEADIERVPQETAPSIVLVPLTVSVQVPGQ